LKNLIIFDLDGVITSEEAYWDCAGLTLHELLYSPRYWHVSASSSYKPAANAQESREISRATLPEWLILSFKARALNSNWDTSYAAVCLHLIDLLSHLPERAALLPLKPDDAQWTASLRAQIAATNLASTWDASQLRTTWREQYPFELPIFQSATGLDLFEHLDAYASQLLGLPIEGVFARSQPFWRFCQDIFQEWLLGDTLYTKTHKHAPAQPDKPGCLFFEEPLLPVEQVRATLATLQARGYTLGIASGRVYQEAAKPLEKYGLLAYFDTQHMGTYDMVTRGEKELRAQDNATTMMLGKPHPFHFQAAVDWKQALQNALKQAFEPLHTPFIAVGDSTSDILGGRAAGALTVAVLTGARTPEARELFLKSQPDFVIEDMTGLPALLDEIENLTTIQKLQFERREVAEKLLRLWFAREMDLATESVRLTPKAVSLNSFNGFYTSEGQEYFFKTHVEEHGVLNEYYNSALLNEAGYNVVRPLRQKNEKERQMVIYPVITLPVMFDLMRAQETGQELPAGITAEALLEAERAECLHLLAIYASTLQLEQDTSAAPVHQLFWHRLTKRFYEFYADKTFPLASNNENERVSFEQVMSARWIINGVEQEKTLGELVTLGQRVLDPKRAAATVVGHGDAHFGNVFWLSFQAQAGNENDVAGTTDDPEQNTVYSSQLSVPNGLAQTSKEVGHKYLYFDPAFAGHHPPLLDIVKPLFHNVFAMWMYFPEEIARDLHIAVRVEDERIIVEHDYHLTPIRQAMLQIKQEQLLKPLLAWLAERGTLPEEWQEILKLALMCCPLLTVDLFDSTKRPPEIGWLGLSQALQLGNGGIAAWKEEKQ
jgi:phosphoglycolate phosphatase-like HAD superfamily hydrolase